MNVTLVRSEDLRPHIRTFYFQAGQPVHYTAGQYVDLRVPHDNPDKRGEWRQFTLSSSPTEPLLAITTKLTSGSEQSGTFKQALWNLQPGTVLQMGEPIGDFILPKDASIPLVFIAGGIGITPFRSMVKSLTDSGGDSHEQRHIRLFHSIQKDTDVSFPEILAHPGIESAIIAERITADTIIANLSHTGADTGASTFYVSGSEKMVSTMVQDLRGHGVQPHQIVTDAFLGYTSA